MERVENFKNITAWVRSNERSNMSSMNPITKAHIEQTQHSPPTSYTQLPQNHWLQRKKAGEKILKGSLFCLSSPYPSDSKGPCKELILLICHHLVQNNFNFTNYSKSNLFIAKHKSIQPVNSSKGLTIYLNIEISQENWFGP